MPVSIELSGLAAGSNETYGDEEGSYEYKQKQGLTIAHVGCVKREGMESMANHAAGPCVTNVQ